MAKTVEELQAEIEALKARIGRAAAHADDDDPGDRGSIPASRFAQHRQQLRDLAAAVDGIKEQLGQTASAMKTASDTAVKRLAAEHKAAIAAETRRASVDLGLSDSGVKDPTIRRLIREHYESQPEQGRAESPTAWLSARRSAAEAAAKGDDKAAAPDPIPWLDAYEAHVTGATKTAPQQEQGRQRRPPVNTDAGAGPKGGDGYTADDVLSMSPDALAKLAGIPVQKTDA